MKIIEWNCQGAFRKKSEQILSLNPDILIISECENQKRLEFGKQTPIPNDFFWYGDNPNKGIGVFSYSEYRFELLKEFNPKYRYIIPLKVSGNYSSFILFAIWAMDNKIKKEEGYIGQIWQAINYYSDLLINDKTVLIGDFNSNKIWDFKDRVGNHSEVVAKLMDKSILSLYHKKYKTEHGEEKHPTFYMYRNKQKPYHIDYCFASRSLLNNNYDFYVGDVDDWIELSDHSPIIVEITIMNNHPIINSLENGLKNKFEKLLPTTKEKFSKLITAVLYQANKSDVEYDILNDRSKRASIIEDAERIEMIDRLLRQMNYKCKSI